MTAADIRTPADLQAVMRSRFPVSEEQAASIATAQTPVWITHATSDPVLPPDFGRTSAEV